jgi:TRAP transporter TAXI family solute receptor
MGIARQLRLAVAVTALAGLTIVAAPAAQAAGAKMDLNFGTGRQGGSQYPVSVAIAQVLEKLPQFGKISLQPGGSVGNVIRVDQGKSDLAISVSNTVYDGQVGNKPYKKKTANVVNLFTLHPFNLAVVVAQDSPIKSLKDFAGHKINIAPKGFSVTELGLSIFDMLGIKGKVEVGYLAIGSAVEAFKDGHVDGLMYLPSDRFGPFINLAQTRKIRLVPIDAPILDKLLKNPSAFRTRFPKVDGVYKNLSNSVDTLGYANVIIGSRTRLSDDQAYAIVKAVAENFDKVRVGDPSLQDFDVKTMAQKTGAPFHPGALKYYRERGWTK